MAITPTKYYIVVFPVKDDVDDVDIIPQNWIITEETCWWPNYRSDKIRRACITNELPKAGWEVTKMRVLKSYNSYDEARKHLLEAEEDSDLPSDGDETPKHRRVLAQKRRLPIGDVESEDEFASSPGTKGRHSRFHEPHLALVGSPAKMPPPPPKKSKNQLKTTKGLLSEQAHTTSECYITPQSLKSVLGPSNDEFSAQELRNVGLDSASAGAAIDNSINLPASELASDRVVQETEAGFKPSRNFEDVVMRNLGVIKVQLKHLQETVDILVQGQRLDRLRSSAEVDLPNVLLPIQNMDDFNNLAERAKDGTVRQTIVSQLAQRGGKDVGKCTRRVMGKLMKDELARDFSWLGSRGDKESFSSTLFKEIVFDAVRQNHGTSEAKDIDIETTIKDWLKNAKKRSKPKEASASGDGFDEDVSNEDDV